MRAVIIGAGIAGLAAALRLSQIGWDSLIIERAPQRRSGGYAVTFGGIGYDAAERMGILPDLVKRSFV
ncbi:MAG: putative oxidoreductase transrane protein, partial [Nonomuraea muscovyensis]|nr:putative oxidoreductase transrane protein [Nonomuraea muscovyensis]